MSKERVLANPPPPDVPPLPRPGESPGEPIFPPKIWIHQPTKWEYRLVERALMQEQLLTEQEESLLCFPPIENLSLL